MQNWFLAHWIHFTISYYNCTTWSYMVWSDVTWYLDRPHGQGAVLCRGVRQPPVRQSVRGYSRWICRLLNVLWSTSIPKRGHLLVLFLFFSLSNTHRLFSSIVPHKFFTPFFILLVAQLFILSSNHPNILLSSLSFIFHYSPDTAVACSAVEDLKDEYSSAAMPVWAFTGSSSSECEF